MSKVGKQSVAESTGGGKGFLLGRYDHALDPKKRFTIPAGWRQILGVALCLVGIALVTSGRG